ncbi:MAG: amidohydrolase family protein [Planctomycetaceae bacterium]
MLNRRDFTAVAAGALAGVIPRLVLPGLYAAEPKPKRASKYIDVHTHVGTYVEGNKELTVKGLLDWMDEHDVERSVVLPLVSPESTTYLQLPDVALQAAKDHPDRLIAFCAIDPRAIISGGVKGLTTIIKKYVDRGAKGFGEHKVGLDFDDPLMMHVYEACQNVGIPLLFHIDGVRGKDQPGLPRLEHAVSTFPGLTFIGHGPGWWASISGKVKEADGYPTGPVEPGGAIDRLFDAYPSIYGDLSAGSGANAIARDKKFGRDFLIRRQDRLMFGTDYLQPGQDVPQFELFESLDLPADVQTKIFKRNAQRVLKLC